MKGSDLCIENELITTIYLYPHARECDWTFWDFVLID